MTAFELPQTFRLLLDYLRDEENIKIHEAMSWTNTGVVLYNDDFDIGYSVDEGIIRVDNTWANVAISLRDPECFPKVANAIRRLRQHTWVYGRPRHRANDGC